MKNKQSLWIILVGALAMIVVAAVIYIYRQHNKVKDLFQAAQTVSRLTKEKEQLTKTVQLASRLNASNITVNGLTDKDVVTDRIKKMVKIEFRFVINKNITAPTGEKTVYIRITKPDNEALIKSRSDVFAYGNEEITYSSKQTVLFDGEELPVTIDWNIEEYLMSGAYRVDIFADGNRIGQKSFKLDK